MHLFYSRLLNKLKPRLGSSTQYSKILKEVTKVNMLSAHIVKKGEFDQNVNDSLLSPPSNVRGMKVLDRDKFTKTLFVPWVAVHGLRLGPTMKHLKKYILRMENFKPMQDLQPDSHMYLSDQYVNKQIVLNPLMVTSFEDISENDRVELSKLDVTEESFNFSELTLTYANWRSDELLKAILPKDKDILTSYSLIGHIVHVNLREHLLEYKQLIGEVLLDKIKGARTIVNKTDIIDNTYRNFSMEILSGENNLKAKVKENYCTFEFDFSSVYWNPRLSTERERILHKLKQGDVLYDVFAGVGPFAIPAAKKKCYVLANDLNPESYRWLKHNAELNKVQNLVHAFNKDGSLFIKEIIREDMLRQWKDEDFQDRTLHITMNLPAMAVEFLKHFKNLFTLEEVSSLEDKHFPIVYVYCFAKGENPVPIAKKMVETALGLELGTDLIDIMQVRNVSVNKEMMRVTFVLSKSILTASCKTSRKNARDEAEDGPQAKRIYIGEDVLVTDGETEEAWTSEKCLQGCRSKESETKK